MEPPAASEPEASLRRVQDRIANDNGHRTTLGELATELGIDLEGLSTPPNLWSRSELLAFAVHAAVEPLLVANEAELRARAQTFNDEMRAAHGVHSAPYFDEWDRLLEAPLDELLGVFSAVDDHAIALRATSPFATVLSGSERDAVIAAVTATERRRRWNDDHPG